ncbi:MAG: hypothetical protein JWP89_3679 [Schlesneria sp.]|nr:hypothetical protein [Schlesneria sp.]
MAHEIRVHPDDTDVLRSELRFMIQYFLKLGQTECDLVFGWHWGVNYPPGRPWGINLTSLSDVEAAIGQPELAGLGKLGHDDVQILYPLLHLDFQFCHHCGIHLTFVTEDQVSRDFFKQWSDAELGPIEREVFDNESGH